MTDIEEVPEYMIPPASHRHWGMFALLLVTLLPLGSIVFGDDSRMEQYFRWVCLVLGSVIPWRFARRGRYRGWAIMLLLFFIPVTLV